MAQRIIICRCEDVTLDDINGALAHGYHDIEEVKRYTGLGTGPCQGKTCMCHCALLVARHSGRPVAETPPFTTRPPLASTALKHFLHPGESHEE